MTAADIDLSDPKAPRSRQFDDFYFQPGQGIEESRFTFIQGCDLASAWREKCPFVVAETGFGTGLNFLLTWQQWRALKSPKQPLHFVSVEAYPLSHAQLQTALTPWLELAPLSRQLLDRYPTTTPGFHRLVFPADRLILTLLIGEVVEQLSELEATVDAWFLDGFAPARNPDMWRPEVFAQLARLSAPGARLATFTAAGFVRRSLQQAGFEVSRSPAFGSKRERLTGRYVGPPVSSLPPWYQQLPSAAVSSTVQAAVVGAGLAGASLYKSLTDRGVDTLIIDPGQASASDNPRANVMPRLSADISLAGRFFWSAFLYATARWRKLPGWRETGTLMVAENDDEMQRFDSLQRCWQLPESMLRVVDPATASELSGLPLDRGGLWFAQSGTIGGRDVRDAWLQADRIRKGLVSIIDRQDGQWQTRDESGQLLSETGLLFLANGPGASALLPHLPLQGFAGQTSWLPATDQSSKLRCTLVHGRYLTAAEDGRHLLGSTYDRFELSRAIEAPTPEAHHRNMAALSSHFPELKDLAETSNPGGWSGLRCTSPDRLPVAGPLVAAEAFLDRFGFLRHSEARHQRVEPVDHNGLSGLLALGSRAFTSAPLAAELAVSQALGEPWPLPRSLALSVHPSRFMVRDLKRRKL